MHVPPRSKNTANLLTFAESAIVEDDTMIKAREVAEDLGITTISPATGATLAVLARISGGNSIVEIGTGAGVSGLWLLSGMPPQGVLTSIDRDQSFQQAAKEAFSSAGIPASRTRLINGRAEEVLPKLSDNTYDLALIDGKLIDSAYYANESIRLLRPGGVLAVYHAAAGSISDTDHSYSEEESHAAREVQRLIASIENLIPVIIPVGTGLLLAVKDSENQTQE